MSDKNKFDMMEADVDAFRGDVLDEDKIARLKRIIALCQKVSELEPDVSARGVPFDNESQHGIVIVDFPPIMACANKSVVQALSEVFSLADDFGFSDLGGTIRLSIGVHDIWSVYHYDYGNGNVTEKYTKK